MGSLSRAAWLTAALVVACGGSYGCAAAPVRHHNHRPLEEEDEGPKPPPPLGPWSDFARLSAFQASGDVAHSAHRVGADAARVLRSPEAAASLAAPQPEGAEIVEALGPAPGGATEVYFVMRKLAPTSGSPAWEYLVVQPDGQLAARGNLELCERCHAEAGSTRLFPL